MVYLTMKLTKTLSKIRNEICLGVHINNQTFPWFPLLLNFRKLPIKFDFQVTATKFFDIFAILMSSQMTPLG